MINLDFKIAPYACTSEKARSRIYKDYILDESIYRNDFETDRNRIINSNSFKRLQHKAPIFISYKLDHYRNRLTQAISSSSVARSITLKVGGLIDLSETIALSIYLGFPPCSYAGISFLNDQMKSTGGFHSKYHSFNVVTSLEENHSSFNGLNLTWGVLEGILKHQGPIVGKQLPQYILDYEKIFDLELNKYPSLEAQIVNFASHVVEIINGLEDSFYSNIITIIDLSSIKFLAQYAENILSILPDMTPKKIVHEVKRKFLEEMISAAIYSIKENIKKYSIKTEEDIRNLGKPIITVNQDILNKMEIVKQFIFEKIYMNKNIISVMKKFNNMLNNLFKIYMEDTSLLPNHWSAKIDKEGKNKKTLILNYITGMSDRFLLNQYKLFFDINTEELGI